MNAVFTVIMVSSLIMEYAAADLQNIQNVNPLNVDLNNPSDRGIVAVGDAQVDEHKLGGYRPLYPPYFLRETPVQKPESHSEPTYYDKEYYTRGSQFGGFNDRLDRVLRLPLPSRQFQRQDHARHIKATYSFSSFRFPNT